MLKCFSGSLKAASIKYVRMWGRGEDLEIDVLNEWAHKTESIWNAQYIHEFIFITQSQTILVSKVINRYP
jgi:hypothetical protein